MMTRFLFIWSTSVSKELQNAVIRGVVVLLVIGLTLFLANKLMDSSEKQNNSEHLTEPKVKPPCGMETRCTANHFPFKIISGAANVVGPHICINDKPIMNNIKNNIGKGLNIALVNASSGDLIATDFFDMWTGNIKLLVDFLHKVKPGTIVLLASFDEPATKFTDEARTLFSELGSSLVHDVKFRDNWIFVGAKPIKEKSPFEQYIKPDWAHCCKSGSGLIS
ncbi:protein FAM3C-like isoform X2 [Chiloscyllium plagiosum]|uniref:protein FAM3C-like isoform X2 n=1 Tax=Chiloscyllium plagiosum TaxID=36176 RepID=UPI001CB86F61|nr:protein FAM3C-like isoform X2 [Chiloscyllium plagiosum]